MTKLRVLVVEDSLTVRRRLVDVLGADPGMEVVGEAGDGALAIELCERLRPDVATFDMMLPGTNGLTAIEHIMAYCPTPIVIVSGSTNRGELFKTYDALAAGAVDVLEKPRGDEPEGVWERKLVATVRLVSRIKVITHPRARLRGAATSQSALDAKRGAAAEVRGTRLGLDPGSEPPRASPRIIAMGASTGGPGAVLQILRGLPGDFPLPITLVIHVGEPFGAALAEWLDEQSPLRVTQARHGEPLPGVGDGRIIMAPPDRHLVVRQGRLLLTTDPARHSCRPSVDVLFESIALELGAGAAACLLTGMGKDGAEGLLAVRRAGGMTLAQDEATSVVFGMPREAILRGAARRVLPIDRMADALVAIAAGAAPAVPA
jgi:two-component system chemotaxis response regulator CheB